MSTPCDIKVYNVRDVEELAAECIIHPPRRRSYKPQGPALTTEKLATQSPSTRPRTRTRAKRGRETSIKEPCPVRAKVVEGPASSPLDAPHPNCVSDTLKRPAGRDDDDDDGIEIEASDVNWANHHSKPTKARVVVTL